MSALAAVLTSVLAIAGCGEDGGEVLVDLRTDLVAGREFVGVRTTVGDRRSELIADPRADFRAGARIAEIAGVKRGTATLRVALIGPSGEVAIEREVRVRVEERVLVTVVLTRSCQGVACPGPADPETLTACLGGQCVDPRCAAEEPEACGTPMCATDSECTAPSECAVAECREGTCFAVADDTRCTGGLVCDPDEGCVGAPPDAGPPDAGPRDAGPRPRDAGMPDAGPPDGGPPPLDDTACDDAHAGAIFCDGFESGDISRWLWDSESNGTVVIQNASHYRGSYAMRGDWTADATAEAYLEARPLTGTRSGDLYLRGYFFMPSSTTFDSLNVYGVGEAGGANDSVVVTFRAGELGVYPSIPDRTYASSAAVPRDRWFCLELHIRVADSGSVELFLDGASILTQSAIDTLPALGYTRLTAGVDQYTPRTTPSGHMYFDELVLDDAPIGCD